jgi:hypothetical protein
MERFRRHYGAGPLHLFAVSVSFALAGYAATALFHRQTLRVAVWFVGAAVGHDLVLLPLYGLANASLTRVWRLAPRTRQLPWLNYVRFPAAISLLLLVVFVPEITRRPTAQYAASGLTNHGYLSHWLLVTGVLFALSGLSYAARLGLALRRDRATPVR